VAATPLPYPTTKMISQGDDFLKGSGRRKTSPKDIPNPSKNGNILCPFALFISH
jgi:hypothetical protein